MANNHCKLFIMVEEKFTTYLSQMAIVNCPTITHFDVLASNAQYGRHKCIVP